MLKSRHVAVMLQTGLTSSFTQDPKSQPKLSFQKSFGENLVAFAAAILCVLMAGKLAYIGSFRESF